VLNQPNFLRTILTLDAVTCVATGTLMAVAATQLSSLMLIPSNVLWIAGMSLFPIAVLIAFVAARLPRSLTGVWLVIGGNAAWRVGSLALLVDGGFSPNALGTAFIVVQAVAVAILAELEFMGLRQYPTLA
jgi:hypothetical protein